MNSLPITYLKRPRLQDGRMVLSFTGWMDGGEVSTSTVGWLVSHLQGEETASIEPAGFYIYNFPGSMEVSAMFRPHVQIEEGLVRELNLPTSSFWVCPETNLVLFVGKEPHLRWEEYGRCVLEVAQALGVSKIYFLGTFAGNMPHTREPRLYTSVSDADLKPGLKELGLRFSDYEGPGSFASYLTTQVAQRGLQMVSLVAEIPAYVQGINPLSIEAMTRQLAKVLGLQLDLSELRSASDEWESRITAAVAQDAELAQQIRTMEEEYDNELIDTSPEGAEG